MNRTDQSSKKLPIIALITNDIIGERMAGPGIRYWEFARFLGQHLPVKLIVPPFISMDHTPSSVDFPASSIHVCNRPEDLSKLAESCDVIVTLGVILYFYPFLADLGKPLVLDMYNPFLLEDLQRMATEDASKQLNSHESFWEAMRLQCLAGDFFICAGEKQRDYWLGVLSAMGRVNPFTYRHDSTLRHLIDVVPFGLPSEPPRHTGLVLKGVYKTIAPTDKVILWGGGIWNWFDASTLLRAMDLVREQRTDLKLFFMGVNRPNQDMAAIKAAEQAITLAQELDLYDRFVFFNDWIPYDERQNYLLEADLGVSLHLGYLETRFAFRTRLLDYLWAGLPIITTSGDVLSETLAAQQLAHLVAPGDVAGVAQTILTLLDNPTLRTDQAVHFQQVATQYRWNVAAQPLLEFCANPYLAPDKGYLRQRNFSNGKAGSRWPLLSKGWRALQMNGVSSLLRQTTEYLRWKISKYQKL